MVITTIRVPSCLEVVSGQRCVVFSSQVRDREHIEVNGIALYTIVEDICAEVECRSHHS